MTKQKKIAYFKKLKIEYDKRNGKESIYKKHLNRIKKKGRIKCKPQKKNR